MERNTKRKLVDIGILAGACLVVALLLRTPLFGVIGAYLVMVASVLVTVVLCIVCSIVCMLFGESLDYMRLFSKDKSFVSYRQMI